MQTTTYGATQPKSKTLSTSAYSAPTAPLAALYGSPYVSSPGLNPTSAAKYTSAASSILGATKPVSNSTNGGGVAGLAGLTTPKPGTSPAASSSTLATLPNGIVPPNMNDLTLDPVYQKVLATDQQNIADANTGALAQAKNALIGYGQIAPDAATNLQSLFAQDPNNPILGALSDTLTAQAAKNNPNATLNQLALNDQQRVGQLNADLNNQNLYYSSTRAAQLGQDANTYRNEQSQATGDLADALSNIYANVLNTRQQSLSDQQNALEQAYQNALQLAAMNANAVAPDQTGLPTNGPAGPIGVITGGNTGLATAKPSPAYAYKGPYVAAI